MLCADETQVADVVRFAAARGWPLSVRGGGHSLVRSFLECWQQTPHIELLRTHRSGDHTQRALYRLVEDGVMIDMSGMKAVSVDTRQRTARVQGRQPDPLHTGTKYRLMYAATGAVGTNAKLHKTLRCAACVQAAPYMQTFRQPRSLTSWLCRGETRSRRGSAWHCTAASGDDLTHATSRICCCSVTLRAKLLPTITYNRTSRVPKQNVFLTQVSIACMRLNVRQCPGGKNRCRKRLYGASQHAEIFVALVCSSSAVATCTRAPLHHHSSDVAVSGHQPPACCSQHLTILDNIFLSST